VPTVISGDLGDAGAIITPVSAGLGQFVDDFLAFCRNADVLRDVISTGVEKPTQKCLTVGVAMGKNRPSI
jgi:hypothetical protein